MSDDDSLVEASNVLGVSVDDFVMSAAIPKALQVIADHRAIVLREVSYEKFLAILDAPVEVAHRLAAQVLQARELHQPEE